MHSYDTGVSPFLTTLLSDSFIFGSSDQSGHTALYFLVQIFRSNDRPVSRIVRLSIISRLIYAQTMQSPVFSTRELIPFVSVRFLQIRASKLFAARLFRTDNTLSGTAGKSEGIVSPHSLDVVQAGNDKDFL